MSSRVWKLTSCFGQCWPSAARAGHVAWLAALLCGAPAGASAQVAIVEHVVPTANSFPEAITLGPDGALWFTEYGANNIARVTIAGAVTEYAVPTAASAPNGITVGPDGALWFTEYEGNKIGRITSTGAITEYPLPTANSFPARITTGPDGALWFTEFNGHKIGRITTQGAIVEYNLAPANYPWGITAGPDGALWFTESLGNQIGRITTAGAITERAVPTADSSPQEITTGSDGALWFTEQSANKIGRISVAGVFTEYPSAGGGPIGITAGLDGALWFTEYFGVKIRRITTAGTITEFPVPTAGFLKGIAVGPHGGLWFAENSANRLGHTVFQTAALTTSPTQGVPGTSVTVSGTGFAPSENVVVADDAGLYRAATADNSGAFAITGPVRPAPYGPNSFVAVGQSSLKLGVAKFFVTPRLFATPSVVTAGTQVTVEGLGFNAGNSVDVYVDGFFFVGSATTDKHGTFAGNNAVTFTITPGLPLGTHFVSGLGSNNVFARTAITVQ